MPAPRTTCSAMSTAAGWPNTRSRPTAPPTARSGRSYDRAEEQVRDLITEAAGGDTARRSGTDEQRIGDLYASFMDEQTVAERGVQPLLDELATIDAAPDPRRAGGGARRAAAHRRRRRRGRLRRHRLQGLDALSAAPQPVRARTARRVLLPRRAARRDPRRLPRAHRARCSPSCTAAATTPRRPRGSSRWRPSWPPRTGTSSSAATPT